MLLLVTSLRAMGVGLFYGAFIFVTTRNFPQGDGSWAVLRSVHICNYYNFPQEDGSWAVLRSVHICNYSNFPQGDGSWAVLRSVHICNYS